jgi:poly(3-hydroxyoctanoate) depolymerase
MVEPRTTLPVDGQLTLGGRAVHVLTQPGADPPILLLGGCGVPSYDWDLVAHLLPDLALVRLDRPGLMDSPWPDELPRLPAEVATLEALIVTVGPALVVAHSMAAFHAEALVRQRPDLVVGLVLVDGSVELAPRQPRSRRGWLWLARLVRRAMVIRPLGLAGSFAQRLLFAAQSHHKFLDPVRPLAARTFREPDTIASVLAEQAAYAAQAWDLTRLRESHNWPGTPTIMLTATAGRAAQWVADQAHLAGLLNARQIVVEDSRHLIMIDRPDVVAEAVRALRGTEDDHE